MAQINIAKIKLRRGTDAQRLTVVLDQGEITYSQDGQRIYVGDGVKIGGLHVASKIHSPITTQNGLTAVNAEKNDVCYADGTLYQLSGSDSSSLSGWMSINSFSVDETTTVITGSNTITVASSGINADHLDPSTFAGGVENDGTNVRVLHDGSFDTSTEVLKISNAGVTEFHISSDALTGVIGGGSGGKINLNYDSTYFVENSAGELSLTDSPSFGFDEISPDLIGRGLYLDSFNKTLNSNISDIDELQGGLSKNSEGVIGLSTPFSEAIDGSPFNNMTVDVHGRISSLTTAITDTLSATSSSNSATTLLGSPDQQNEGFPIANITEITGLSSNGITTETVYLSSSGFITFSGDLSASSGKNVPRFAIPIYTF